MQKQNKIFLAFYKFGGIKYLTASILPVLIGTTLPFWLNPPNFEFNIINAILFLIMTIIGHSGFSLIYIALMENKNLKLKRESLLIWGLLFLTVSIILGLLINSSLQFQPKVPEYIFIIYGMTTVFAGVLYVFPPFSFHQRLYGDMVISVGLGMLPVLGAYLIQVGDITRTVYLASLPVVVSTGLWVWITELINLKENKKKGYKTTVMYFNKKFSSRIITIFLILIIYVSLVLAVFGRSSLNPISLTALFSIIFAGLIIKKIWTDYKSIKVLKKVEKYAFLIHLSICIAIILASFSSIFK